MEFDLGLQEHHKNEIVNYIRFARYQRNQCLKTVNLCLQDIKETQLTEETYTKDEVEGLLQYLTDAVASEVESEFMNSSHTSIILLRQLFQQAEVWHLKLQANISELENNDLLQKIKSFEETSLIKSEQETCHQGGQTKLEPMNEAGGSVLLQMKIQQLTEENEKLKEQMKTEALVALKEKSSLKEELEKLLKADLTDEEQKIDEYILNNSEMETLQQQLRDVQCKLSDNEIISSDKVIIEKDLTTTKHQLLEARMQLEKAEKELEKKFSETSAYNNLKKMLSKKNEQIKDLRKRLLSYEPEAQCDDE